MSSRHRGEVKVKVYTYSTRSPLHHQERRDVGLTSEPVWMGLENLTPTGFQTPDSPVRTEEEEEKEVRTKERKQ